MRKTNLNQQYALQIAPHIPKPAMAVARVAQARAPQYAREEINNVGNDGNSSVSSESGTYDSEDDDDDDNDESSNNSTNRSHGRASRSATAAQAAKNAATRNPKLNAVNRGDNMGGMSHKTKSAVVTTHQRQLIKETISRTERIDIADSEESSGEDTRRSSSNNKNKKQSAKNQSKRGRSDSNSSSGNPNTSKDTNKRSKPNEPGTIPTDIYVSHAEFYSSGRANMRGLREALSSVMCQEDAIEQVIYKLQAQALTPFRSPRPSDRICSLHLTGGSGVGKTETTRILARYLGVGEGTRYPQQYKPISLSKYHDQSHASALTGAAAGLLGHDNVDLVAQLIQASTRVNPDEDVPFIVLGLDEACKAHAAIMNSLNPLLSDGSITNVREQTFTIPRGTLLLILWTSNFAEHVCNPYNDPEETTRYIYDRMRRKGYDNCDIARMGGDPIVYAPLSHRAMYNILERCGNARLGNHTFSRDYGVPRYRAPAKTKAMVKSVKGEDEQLTNSLILNILSTYKVELGVRHPLEKYKIAIEGLLTTAVDVVERAEDERQRNNYRPPTTKLQLFDDSDDGAMNVIKQEMDEQLDDGTPVYWCVSEQVTAEECGDPERLAYSHPALSEAIGQNRRNKRVFEIIVKQTAQQKQPNALIEFVTLRFRDKRGQLRHAHSVLQPASAAGTSSLGTSSGSSISIADEYDDDDGDGGGGCGNMDVVDLVREFRVQLRSMEERLTKFTGHFETIDATAAKQANQLQILLKNQITLQGQMGALCNTSSNGVNPRQSPLKSSSSALVDCQ